MADNGKETHPSFRPEKYLWLKRQVSLDMMRIDEELMEIPVLIQEAGENVALAMEIREAAKSDLEVEAAKQAANLRNIKLESGKPPSETAVDKMVPLTPEYEQKLTILSQARLDAGLWQSIMEALRTKSSAIRTVADLVAAGWLSRDHIIQNRRREIRNAQPSVTSS